MRTETLEAGPSRPALWSVILSGVACLTCPVCLGVIAAVLPAVGHGVALEAFHGPWAVGLVLLAFGTSTVTAVRRRRFRPLAVAAAGTAVVLAGELWLHAELFSLAGYALLLGANVWSWRASRRPHAHVPGAECC